MPTIAQLRQVYRGVNLCGHLQNNVLSLGANFNQVVDRTVRARNLHGVAAFENRALLNTHVALGITQAIDRLEIYAAARVMIDTVIDSMIIGGPLAMPKPAGLWLWPLAELVVGKSHRIVAALEPDAPILIVLGHAFDRATEHGLLGGVFECAPLALAAWAENTGRGTTAKACLAAAIVGRTVLQVPRAFLYGVFVVHNASVITGWVVAMALVERTAVGLKWAVDTAVPPQGRELGIPRRFLNGAVGVLQNPFDGLLDEGPIQDDLAEVVDPAGGGMNERVTGHVNAALRRFADVDETVDDGRLVRETADHIVADLRRFCANAPDDTAFRGGVALLRNFIDITYDDAHWVAPERA
jgi:hypothetical protein